MGIGYSIVVSTINAIFKKVALHSITMLKLSTKSNECNVMMLTVYVMTFFNTAVLIVLLHSNFSESKWAWLKFFFSSGKQSDWNTEWYSSVGPTLIQTMLIQCFTPLVEIGISFAQVKVFRWLDRGFTMDMMKTKQKTVYAHTELYCGPEYHL